MLQTLVTAKVFFTVFGIFFTTCQIGDIKTENFVQFECKETDKLPEYLATGCVPSTDFNGTNVVFRSPYDKENCFLQMQVAMKKTTLCVLKNKKYIVVKEADDSEVRTIPCVDYEGRLFLAIQTPNGVLFLEYKK